ncbi:MAG: trimethylamine methyltransferase family protein [Candidatus Promineifilaceae bacterium]
MSEFTGAKKRKSTRRSRRGRRGQDNADRPQTNATISPARSGVEGGKFRPISNQDLPKIDAAIRHILTHIGVSEVPKLVSDSVIKRGGSLSATGRLTFTNTLIDQFLAGCRRDFMLCGQTPEHDIALSGARVYLGTGGAAPQVVDLDTGRYRNSTLYDLYNAARLTDRLDNIHFFSRSLVARDMPNDWLLDVNTVYASLVGTTKHVLTSVTLPEHVAPLAEMFYTIAGSREAFEARPFVSFHVNHAVPPLRLHKESIEVMAEAVKLGIPVHSNVFSQVGASTPVTMAGTIAQNSAEALAGMIFAWLINPDAKIIMGVRPMITDLRTGGFSGGSGEQALIMAATAQVAQYYKLPNSSIAGATDSKLADAQSGYEKSMTVTLAAQAGSNLVTQACGMHAGLMSVAFESYVIDNDMLGGVMRSLSPIEINDETLATGMISEIVRGEGHFLGHPETYKRMQSDFLYPEIADRKSAQEWEDAGSLDIRAVAKMKTKAILASHYPTHISAETDAKLRAQFDIRLPKTQMKPV